MAAADIFVWEDESGGLHTVDIDLVVSHDDDRSSEVTSHPIEKGAAITDHIIQGADKLTIEIAQTNSPFPTAAQPGVNFVLPKGFATKTLQLNVQPNAFKPGGLLAATAAVSGLISSATNALGLTAPPDAPRVSVFTSDTPTDRIGTLHDALIDVKQKGRLCTITIRGKIYPDYILTSVKWSTAKNEAGLGRFSLGLQKITIVENAIANLPDPASLRLKPAKTQTKPAKPVSADAAPNAKGSESESMLSKATGGSGTFSS